MNRLWVRLSMAMSGLILLFTVLPLFAFLVFEPPKPVTNISTTVSISATPVASATPAADPLPGERPPRFERRFFDPWHDLPENLLRAVAIASIAGIGGGVLASRILAAPITKLSTAARAIGGGDLSARVPLTGNSREIDELAHTFNRMAADLQRGAELRNSLMADVSHELRTPLTVLEGNLRAALDHVYELDDEQIANLYEQTRHLISLVNELRELTLAEAAQLPLDKKPIDLALLAEETAAVFAPLTEEKGVHLVVQMAAQLPLVNADRLRLRQVLHNLFANALRHTPTTGAITIRGEQVADRVRLTVQDTGDGIPAEHLAHIFDRFYRTDPSRSRETGGSGLGLAIVKAIVEAHGGAVAATSDGVGQGTTFAVYLPVAAG